jgi:hypothetical protein
VKSAGILATGLIVAGSLVGLAGCGDSATEPAQSGRLQRVEGFTPGGTATLVGRGLARLTSLTVDGAEVSELVVLSDSEVTFRVPVLRECETDGRRVRLLAGGTDSLRAPLQVDGVVTMGIGESRVLAAEDVECLRLAARDEDYVISAAATDIPAGDEEVLRPLLLLRSWTEGSNWPDWVRLSPEQSVPVVPHHDDHQQIVTQLARMTGGSVTFSDDPTPFDPRYATATAGELVTMVDWRWTATENEALCQLPKAQVPTYNARVVASTRRIVLAVDTRSQFQQAYTDPATNGWLHDAASIAESVLLPAMRAVFDPGFEPLRGGGGRYFVIFGSSGGMGFAWDGAWPGVTGGSQSVCGHSSEMTTVRLNAEVFSEARYRDASYLSSILIHEYAHNVDARVHLRAGKPSNSSWYLNEAWATAAEETASRLASQQPLSARPSAVSSAMPYNGTIFRALWGRTPRGGPWQYWGRYSISAQMLLFLRELAGEADAAPRTPPTFHQQLYADARDWTDRPATVPLVAAAVGLTHAELVDRHALAAVTAGLLTDAVIQQRQLPHFRSWDFREMAAQEGPLNPSFNGRLSRRTNQRVDLTVADGGYGAVYLMADDGRGISLQNLRATHASGVVRLTRLR